MGLLRFLLAISVVLAHSSSFFGFNLTGAQIAVQSFYIISGFYMSLILNEKYIGANNSFKLFITNRFLRLYPIYWIVLVLTLLYSVGISIVTKGTNYADFTNYIEYFHVMGFGSFIFLIFTNIFLFFQDVVMFLGLNVSNGHLFFTSNFRETTPMLFKFLFLPQAWTIGVEITFYLFAPFLVRRKLSVIMILIIMSLLLRTILYYNGCSNDPWSYRFFPTELVFFLLGILSYKLLKFLKEFTIDGIYLKIIFIVLILFTLFFDRIPFVGNYFVYIIFVFISLPFIFRFTNKSKVDRYIGELSYPIYISHLFVGLGMNVLNINDLISYKGVVLTVMTVLFSIALNELVTKKIEKFRQKRLKTI